MNKFLTVALAIAAAALLAQDVSASGAPQWDRVDALMANKSLPQAKLDSALDSLQSASYLNEDVRGENGRKHILLLLHSQQPFYEAQDGVWKRRIGSTNYALLSTEGYLVVVAWQGKGKNFRRYVNARPEPVPFRWWFVYHHPATYNR